MNNDLIFREALLEAFANSEHIKETTDGLDVMEMLAIKEIIDNAPTVKQRDNFDLGYIQGLEDGKKERKQGEWIDEGQYAEGHSEHAYRCKKCGYHIIELPNMIFENRFCKYCGADMKGGAE